MSYFCVHIVLVHVPSTHFDASAYAHITPLVLPTSDAKRPQPIFCGFAAFQVLIQGMKFPIYYAPSNMAFLKLRPSKFDQFWVHTSIPMSPWIWEKDMITHHTSPLIFRIENYYHYQLFEVFMQHFFSGCELCVQQKCMWQQRIFGKRM